MTVSGCHIFRTRLLPVALPANHIYLERESVYNNILRRICNLLLCLSKSYITNSSVLTKYIVHHHSHCIQVIEDSHQRVLAILTVILFLFPLPSFYFPLVSLLLTYLPILFYLASCSLNTCFPLSSSTTTITNHHLQQTESHGECKGVGQEKGG